MVDKTVEQLLVSIQRALYQQAGVSTQIYSQDQLVEMIKDSYQLLYSEQFWKRFITYQVYTLDGINGYTTTPVSSTFAVFDDILKVFPDTSDVPLSAWSNERNPSRITGGQALQYLANTANVIQIVPTTATGDITILGRVNPIPALVNLASVIPFDDLAIKYFTCWQYAVDDGTNAAMEKKFKGLYEVRLRQLKAEDLKAPIAINGRAGRIPNTWEEY